MTSTIEQRESSWKIASAIGIVCLILLMLTRLLFSGQTVSEPVTSQPAEQEQKVVTTVEVETPAELPIVEPPEEEQFVFVREPAPVEEPEPATVEENPFLSFDNTPQPEPEPADLDINFAVKPTMKARIRQAALSNEFNEQFLLSAKSKLPDPKSLLAFIQPDDWAQFKFKQETPSILPTAYQSPIVENQITSEPLASESIESIPIDSVGPQQVGITVEKILPATSTVGQNTKYQLVIKNHESSTVDRAIIEESVPNSVQVVDVSPPALLNNQKLHWQLTNIQPGEERLLNVEVFPTSAGEIETVAAISSTKTIAFQTEVQSASIALKTEHSDQTEAGQPFSLKFLVTNTGPTDLSHIQLNVELPLQFSHRHGHSLLHRIDDLATGEETTIALNVTVADVDEQPPLQVLAKVTADENVTDQTATSVTIAKNTKQPESVLKPVPIKSPAPNPAVPSIPCPCVNSLYTPAYFGP